MVLKWSRARKRYERQGLLVELGALETAEQECLDDNEARMRRRERAAERREELDRQYVERFAAGILSCQPSKRKALRSPFSEAIQRCRIASRLS